MVQVARLCITWVIAEFFPAVVFAVTILFWDASDPVALFLTRQITYINCIVTHFTGFLTRHLNCEQLGLSVFEARVILLAVVLAPLLASLSVNVSEV